MSISRRNFLQAGIGAAASTFLCGCGQHQPEIICTAKRPALPGKTNWLQSTGDRRLDQALIRELHMQRAFFGYRPGFILFSGRNNAIASSRRYLPRTDGTIFFSIDFLRRHLHSNDWGGAVVSGIVAHEGAHIFQYNSGAYRVLERRGSAAIELHSDVLCGCYMGVKSRHTRFDPDDYFVAFHRMGDYDTNASNHHGTPQQRYRAVVSGYELGRSADLNAASAHHHAMQFIFKGNL